MTGLRRAPQPIGHGAGLSLHHQYIFLWEVSMILVTVIDNRDPKMCIGQFMTEYLSSVRQYTSLNHQYTNANLSSIVNCFVINTLWSRVAHEIRAEPSTEYNSRHLQCSAYGQRLREHCPRFSCCGILQCWWSPYEMSDEKTGSLVHILFIQGCPGSFTCLSIEHWVQGTL